MDLGHRLIDDPALFGLGLLGEPLGPHLDIEQSLEGVIHRSRSRLIWAFATLAYAKDADDGAEHRRRLAPGQPRCPPAESFRRTASVMQTRWLQN
ncbi:hypothetical protein McPS_19600 [Marichromatium sp. PS1]